MKQQRKKRNLGGRPVLPLHLKRVRCGSLRLPRWLLDWLRGQGRPMGRIIEEALVEKYGLERPEKGQVDEPKKQ